ncbi:MAG: WG repeat-containing protein, partial [Bacteroidetes bacterium]|nr:WG repeat-containing protein [Bacteroidota bacterium]
MIYDVAVPEVYEDHSVSYYKQDGKYGFILEGNLKQEAVYDRISSGVNGFIVVKDNKYGITNQKAEIILSPSFDSIRVFNPYYLIKVNNKYGVLSSSGELIQKPSFDKIFGVNKYVTVIQDNKGKIKLVLNTTGEIMAGKNIQYV